MTNKSGSPFDMKLPPLNYVIQADYAQAAKSKQDYSLQIREPNAERTNSTANSAV